MDNIRGLMQKLHVFLSLTGGLCPEFQVANIPSVNISCDLIQVRPLSLHGGSNLKFSSTRRCNYMQMNSPVSRVCIFPHITNLHSACTSIQKVFSK